jgi:hypothetical protein
MRPDAPGAPMFARTTLVKAIKPIKAHQPVLVPYGREYKESVFDKLAAKK